MPAERKQLTVATVVGARPQFIKAAAVSRLLRAQPTATELLIHTGQHYDENMSQVFFDELQIPRPEYQLSVGSGSHGEMTGKMLAAIERILQEMKPDWMLVYGDTNSTLAGALAAAKLNIPTAHVEAGLRSFNRRMPEEVNRVLTDHASELLFAPTDAAVENLRREGITGDKVQLVGDVMYDAAQFYGERAAASAITRELELQPQGYILATIHRAENTDDPARLRAVVTGLAQAAQKLPVVMPLHPRTRAALERNQLIELLTGRVRLVPPVGYLEMIALERGAALVVTDSGGVQKEAYFQRVPCLTLRDETEWVELVEHGWNRLAPPTDGNTIATAILDALARGKPTGKDADLYGGGSAAARIVESLLSRG